jgi:hypothetical protein
VEVLGLTIVLSTYGRTFASRPHAREVLNAELGPEDTPTITIDASDVYMSPSFIAELLVVLVKERECKRVVLRGAREHPARVAANLTSKLGYADRVEVEQPQVGAT